MPLSIPRLYNPAAMNKERTRLTGTLGTTTDPAQQARINTRLGFLDRRANQNNPLAAKQLTTLQERLADPNLDAARQQRIRNRIGFISRRTGLSNPLATQPQTPASPATPAPPTVDPGTATGATAQTPAAPVDTSAFFPNTGPGSGLFDWQSQQGLRALDRMNARDGLVGSGAAIEGANQFMTQLTGQEIQRQLDNRQRNADRLTQLSSDASLQQERTGNEQFDRAYQLLSLLAGQNPTSIGADSAGRAAGMTQDETNTLSKMIAQMFPRATGGGGGSQMPFVPAFPSGPNMGAINAIGAQTGASNGTAWGNAISTILGLLLGGSNG